MSTRPHDQLAMLYEGGPCALCRRTAVLAWVDAERSCCQSCFEQHYSRLLYEEFARGPTCQIAPSLSRFDAMCVVSALHTVMNHAEMSDPTRRSLEAASDEIIKSLYGDLAIPPWLLRLPRRPFKPGEAP